MMWIERYGSPMETRRQQVLSGDFVIYLFVFVTSASGGTAEEGDRQNHNQDRGCKRGEYKYAMKT